MTAFCVGSMASGTRQKMPKTLQINNFPAFSDPVCESYRCACLATMMSLSYRWRAGMSR
jgi:hypothetical protein